MHAFVYILRRADGSYDVGSTRGALETRVAEHDNGVHGGYTVGRRPVRLAWSRDFDRVTDAERQLKGWSRAKNRAWIADDPELLRKLSRRGAKPQVSKELGT